MVHSVTTRGLTGVNLFKLLLLGLLFSIGPIILVIGILCIFGIGSISLGSFVYTGFSGFVASLPLIFLVPVVVAIVLWLFLVVGLWLYSRIKPIKLVYKSANTREDNLIIE